MRNHKINLCMLLWSVLTLTGCAHLNDKFDCPMKPGINCESIDQVNARVERGEFADDCQSTSGICREVPSITYTAQFQTSSLPRLSPTKTLRVVIAPYIDTTGNLHSISAVYTVIGNPHWIVGKNT